MNIIARIQSSVSKYQNRGPKVEVVYKETKHGRQVLTIQSLICCHLFLLSININFICYIFQRTRKKKKVISYKKFDINMEGKYVRKKKSFLARCP